MSPVWEHTCRSQYYCTGDHIEIAVRRASARRCRGIRMGGPIATIPCDVAQVAIRTAACAVPDMVLYPAGIGVRDAAQCVVS